MHQYATLEDTVYFGFAVNDTTGTGADGTSPTFDVRLAGAAAGAAPVLDGTPTLLSHANYGAGAYEIAVEATNANGFAADGVYLVFCGVTVSAVNPTGFVGSFKLSPVPANLKSILGTALTETAGLLAAGFKKFFNVATPTGTLNSLPDAVPAAAGGLLTTTVWTAARGAALDNLDVAISTRLATASYTAPSNATIAAIAAVMAKIDTALVQDGAVYQFTANALELGPSGSGGDPWDDPLPGAYAAGTAGYILGTYLDSAISSITVSGSGSSSSSTSSTISTDPADTLANLRIARAAIAAELASMDSTKAGGKPDHAASGVGHVAYYNSRLSALKVLDEMIASAQSDSAAGGDGPFEIYSEFE